MSRLLLFVLGCAGAIGSAAYAQHPPKDLDGAGTANRLAQKASAIQRGATPDPTANPAQRAMELILMAQRETDVSTQPQRKALSQLQQRASTTLSLKLHPQTGAVRELKGDASFHPAGSNARETAKSFLRANGDLLKIKSPDDEFTLSNIVTDDLARQHLRFDQQYGALAVWPAQMIVHLDPAGNVDLVNGAYVPTPEGPVEFLVTRERAIETARTLAPDGDRGTVQSAQGIFYATDEGIARLGWKIELSIAQDAQWIVVIDARDGSKLAAYNTVAHAGTTGSGLDLFNQSRVLQVFQDGASYYLMDTSKKMYDPASPSTMGGIRGAIVIADAKHAPAGNPPDGTYTITLIGSTSATSGWLPDGVSAAYGLSEVYDYYLERHLRNSIDGNGGTIKGIVRYGTGYKNAYWSSATQIMVFGDGVPEARSLDIVAHEMTHGVTSSTSKLEYQNQSGALNEAMSDIFGEAVEARTRGASDWVHGADLGTANRSLKDPHSLSNGCSPTNKPYPAKMSEFLSATSTDLSRCVSSDYGGVHINSSIINHAFYQLTAGLPGAIGMRDAERIFYRALTLHLAPKSQFVDARLAAVTSADELFGKNSTQSQKVAQAFDYVEIVDTTATAPPAVIPAVAGVDSTMFLFKDAKGWQLGRRETALGDANGGNYVVASPVSYEKIAVDGGGNFAIFITADNDFCVVQTNGSKVSCAGLPHSYNSAALSPSGRTVALVLLDSAGDPKNQIVMVDVSTGASTSIVLRAAATDGASLNVLYADAMVFDFKKSRLFYDAVTELPGVDGAAKSYVWAIYALDIASSVTVSVIPPIAGLNVANPTLGHVRNDLLAFDALDPKSGDSAVYIYNLTTGKLQKIGNTVLGYGFPTFTGDDKSLVYSHRDSAQPSGRTLLRQALGTDFMTPAGAVATWLTDGDVATVYRRGTFASGTTVVEYYHSGLDNYFITADPIEQSFVDSGGAGAWKRTNLNFKAGGTRPVCRFYGNRFGPNSHFYTADEDECASLISNYSPAAKSWGLESYDFATTPSANGTCPAGLVPVYRAYNNGFARGVDSNHRITSNVAAYQQTIASGWKGEGVTMCSPQ